MYGNLNSLNASVAAAVLMYEDGTSTPGEIIMLKDILIVDGYNVIFAWTHLKKLAHESLEHARMELRDRLLNYGKFKGYEVILVFDGKYTKSGGSIESITSGFIEVYTEDGETADSFIEREVFFT